MKSKLKQCSLLCFLSSENVETTCNSVGSIAMIRPQQLQIVRVVCLSQCNSNISMIHVTFPNYTVNNTHNCNSVLDSHAAFLKLSCRVVLFLIFWPIAKILTTVIFLATSRNLDCVNNIILTIEGMYCSKIKALIFAAFTQGNLFYCDLSTHLI